MCDATCSPGIDRRHLFLTGAGLAAGATVLRVDPASAESGRRKKRYVFEGEFTDPSTADWHYLPFRVPKGVARIQVSYTHEPVSGPISTNVVDIGIFDPSGKELGDARGFRGWSGGARDRFFLTRGRATPGYLAGPLTPGRWHVILGPYQINGEGTPYRVEVTLTFGPKGERFAPEPAPVALPGGPGWYRGDLHTHTVHSDGRWTRPQLVRAARAAGLDLVGSAEHNTSSATRTWGRHAPDDLLVVCGEEVTTRNGHWVAMGLPAGTWIDWRYRGEDEALPTFLDQVHELGGVAIVAHPQNIVPSIKWEQNSDFAGMDAMEVWNGPWKSLGNNNRAALTRWHAMLVQGRFLPAVGSSDSHHDGQPVGLPHTVYRMEGLSTTALVDAVRGGHCWVAESSAVELELTAEHDGQVAGCGDHLDLPDDGVAHVRLSASGVPGTFAVLHGATGPLGVAVADPDGVLLLEADVPATERFVRAEVGRPSSEVETPDQGTPVDEMVALTNPVLLGWTGGEAGTTGV